MIGLQNTYYMSLSGAADAVGTKSIGEAVAPRLGTMALTGYKRARLGVHIALSQASASGSAKVRLVAGGVTLREISVSLSSGQEIDVESWVDLVSVEGQTPIVLQCEIATAAAAGTKYELSAVMDVETPIVT